MWLAACFTNRACLRHHKGMPVTSPLHLHCCRPCTAHCQRSSKVQGMFGLHRLGRYSGTTRFCPFQPAPCTTCPCSRLLCRRA